MKTRVHILFLTFLLYTVTLNAQRLIQIDTISVNSGLLVGSEVTDAKFDGVNLYLHKKIKIIAQNGSAGLLVPSAVNSSITNSAIYLKDGVVYAGQPQQPVKVSGVRPPIGSSFRMP